MSWEDDEVRIDQDFVTKIGNIKKRKQFRLELDSKKSLVFSLSSVNALAQSLWPEAKGFSAHVLQSPLGERGREGPITLLIKCE